MSTLHDALIDTLWSERLRSLAVPIFAACETKGPSGKILTVHVAAATRSANVKDQIREALAGVPAAKVRIRFHRASALLAPRSLERLVGRFPGRIVFDPTGSIARAQALVTAAKTARETLGAKVAGLYYAPRMRTLFVALRARAVAPDGKVKVGTLGEIERQVVSVLRTSFGTESRDCPAVRLGFGLPVAQLVAVDHASTIGWGTRAIDIVRRSWKPVAIATLFGLGGSAAAVAKDPAVSQTNLKVTGTAGATNDESSWFVNGSLTAPLGHAWGLQIEAGGGGTDDDTTVAAGGHLFTRDPDSYLLGLFAAYASEDKFDLDATRLGAEAELYLNQVSILLAAGYQFSDSIEETAFGDIELRWYITNDFVVSAGGNFEEDRSLGRAGIEWQPGFSALPGLAFRVDGVFGEDDHESIMGGLTYYFGANASLKDRHRRQDPSSALLGLLQSVQHEQQKLCVQYGGC